MPAWLKMLLPATGRLAGIFAWWKVAAIGAVVLVASHGGTAIYAYNSGWHNAHSEYAAENLRQVRAHSEWLLRVSTAAGVLSVDDSAIEVSNEQLERGIEDAIAKTQATIAGLGVCVYADVLHSIARLR